MRHIKFRMMSDLAREGLKEVVLAAIEYDKVLKDEACGPGRKQYEAGNI